jgi:hypothetical protein
MIFNRGIFFLWLFPIAAFSASQPCGLSDFEQSGKGWLSSKNPEVLRYVVGRKQFESVSMPKSWTVSLQSREAAHKAFSEYFRKMSQPPSDKSILSVKGMQAKEMHCPEGFFIFFDVNIASLSWEASTFSAHQARDDFGIPIGLSNPPTEQRGGTPPQKQSVVTPLGVPKVVLED